MKTRILLTENTNCKTNDRLRRSHQAPLSEADKASWERWAETAFCSLVQNPGYVQDHETLVHEAGLIADTFVNMAKARFESDNNEPVTNVFRIPEFGVAPRS